MNTLEYIKEPTHTKEKAVKVKKTDTSGFCAASGIMVFSCIMAYFIIMRSIGLHEVFMLRYINSIFLFAGILLAIRSYKKVSKNTITYKQGLRMGMGITLIAVIPFAIFLYFYLAMDNSFMDLIKNNTEIIEFSSPGTVASYVGLEGLCCGLIITFILIQYMKKDK